MFGLFCVVNKHSKWVYSIDSVHSLWNRKVEGGTNGRGKRVKNASAYCIRNASKTHDVRSIAIECNVSVCVVVITEVM